MEFADLKHVRKPLSGGGQVVVIDTGALITPEADAMLQALHSRSIGGVDAHLLKLAQKGAKDFMETYYVGYGDKSIGDCGTVTIFIEGVSMLVAKAVQDSQLYNGQESSTRYIDFSKQSFGNPAGSAEGAALLEALRAFHLEGLEVMKQELAARHPQGADEEEKIWRKAINTRAFDIMRSFLPAGAATNLAWHGTLRTINDQLLRLRNHPLPEVQAVAEAIETTLEEAYPSSFKHKRYEATEVYAKEYMAAYYLDEPAGSTLTVGRDNIDHTILERYGKLFADRPQKAELPKFLAECGTLQFTFSLDFGSFRDLQRHRSILQRMPLLSDAWGFEQWYLEQMPDVLRSKAHAFLADYKRHLDALNLSAVLRQYYVPMGYRVSCRIIGDLPALAWVVELRSGISVHPTLRVVAQKMGEELLRRFGDFGLKLYIDETSDRFNYKRGLQDIVEK